MDKSLPKVTFAKHLFFDDRNLPDSIPRRQQVIDAVSEGVFRTALGNAGDGPQACQKPNPISGLFGGNPFRNAACQYTRETRPRIAT
jgi:hypothetical protein